MGHQLFVVNQMPTLIEKAAQSSMFVELWWSFFTH